MNAYSPQAYTIPGIAARQADRAVPLQRTPLHLAPVGAKAMTLDFAGGRLSSDAGLVLRKDPDEPRGFTRDLAAVRSDPGDPRRVHCTLPDLRKQRVLPMAAGYEDANDAHTLRHDPLCTLLLDRLPETGPPLASPPTLSRFANRVSRPGLSRMARGFLEQCLASYARPPQRIVLDVADTEDPVHGEQEQARYEAYYGGYGCLPRHLYAGLAGRLITTIFKAKRCTGAQRLAGLQRLSKRLRHAWPDTLRIFRGESHCASPEVRQWIEAQPNCSYVTGLTSNALLQELAREVVEQAQRAYERDRRTITRFHSTRYQAGAWSHARRVVLKVAVSDQGVHTRCVVTDLEQARPKVLSQHISCARGQAENEIKDHTRSRHSDRTSCHRFEANQFRLFLPSAASG